MKCFIKTLLLVLVAHCALAQNTATEWQRKLKVAKDDTSRLQAYTNAAEYYLNKNLDSSFLYLKKAEIADKKCPDGVQRMAYYITNNMYFTLKGRLDSSMYYCKKTEVLAKRLKNDRYYHIAILNQISTVMNNGRYTDAIKQYLQFEKTLNDQNSNNSDIRNALYNDLSYCYSQIFNDNKSNYYLAKMLLYCKNSSDSLRYYNKLFYFGIIHNRFEHDTYSIAMKLAQKTKNLDTYLMLMINATDFYIKHNEVDKAITMLKEVIKLSIKNKLKVNEFYGYENMAEAYSAKKKYQKAIYYFKKTDAFYLGDVLPGIIAMKRDSYEKRSKCSAAMGDYKNAYVYYLKAAKMSEELSGKEKQKMVAELETQYQLADKQEQIAAKTLENKLKEERIKVEQSQKYILMGLVALALGLLGWAVWSYRKQKQLSELIEQKKNILETQTQELTEANQTKDKIFAVLGHDLRSPLNDLKIILLLFHSKDITPSKMKSMIQDLTAKMNSVQEMLNNLLQWSLLELKHQPIQLKPISIKKIIEKAIGQLSSFAEKKEIFIETNLMESNVLGNAEEVEIIVRNLLSNAIKFTPKGGKISLDTFAQDDNIVIRIKDSGVGIPEELKLETSHYPVSKTGTAGETGVGLGLKISRELAKRNGAEIFIESKQDNGTEITLAFPNAGQVKNNIHSNQILHV